MLFRAYTYQLHRLSRIPFAGPYVTLTATNRRSELALSKARERE